MIAALALWILCGHALWIAGLQGMPNIRNDMSVADPLLLLFVMFLFWVLGPIGWIIAYYEVQI